MTQIQTEGHPNYQLRVTIVALVMSVVAVGIILVTPAQSLSSWQYWVFLGAFVVAVWVIYELQPLPKPGRKRPRPRNNRGFGPRGTALLLAYIIGLITITRVNASLATILNYSFFPGIIVGLVSVVSLDFLVKGRNRFCQNCTEYKWFRPKHGSLFCTSCGWQYQDLNALIESPPLTLDPVTGPRIMRESRDIPPLGNKAPKCRKCKSTMQLTTIKAFSGKADGLRVSFFDMPCFACPNDHTKRYPGTEFGTNLLDEITDGLPRLEVRGSLRQSLVCPKCNNGFEIAEHKDTFGLQIGLDALSEFLVDVYLATTTCPTCKSRYALLDEQMISNVSDAVANAFNSIRLER